MKSKQNVIPTNPERAKRVEWGTEKSDIHRYRKEIDRIDEQIVGLLIKRLKVVKEIGKWKVENGKWKVDRKREMEVLENVKKHAPKELYPSIETIYKTIIKVSKKIQV